MRSATTSTRARGGVIYGRAGRIAGSSCVPAASLFGPDKTLKPIADLRAAFEGVGAAPDKRVLVYCGGGIAATLDAFVLTALLGPQERLGVRQLHAGMGQRPSPADGNRLRSEEETTWPPTSSSRSRRPTKP